MKRFYRLVLLVFCQSLVLHLAAQSYFRATATIVGNSIYYRIKPINGNITCGWSDIEFFFRNASGAPEANSAFNSAIITVNTADFPGVSIPYNGMNVQGTEVDYNNYWFGVSFGTTTPKTYNQNQEYIVCTITLLSSPTQYVLELCHNEPNFYPHYIVLTDQSGTDWTNLTGTNKFYGPGAVICNPDNCPITTSGDNHILPLNGGMPVELVDFQAKKYEKKSALLEWHTATEIGFDAFGIERLTSVGQWKNIGWEKGKATAGAGASYAFIDEDAEGPVSYYRLKMLDYDGTFEYSPIRQVQIGAETSMRVFPNPVSDIAYLEFGAGLDEESMDISLFDWSGRQVLQQHIVASAGLLHELFLREYQLPPGSYLLRANSASGFQFAQNLLVHD